MARAKRSRQILVAGCIAALHIVVIYAFAAMTVRREQRHVQPETPIALLNVVKREPARPVTVPQLSAPVHRPLDAPKAPVIAITVPNADDLAALRSYVWCGALDDGKVLAVSPKPCDNMKLELRKGAVGSRQPTENEKAQTQAFDRQYAIAKAPALLPCFGGGGVSLLCLAGGIAKGFEFTPGSYAGFESGKCDSRFAGAAACARNYSLQSFAPTNRPASR